MTVNETATNTTNPHLPALPTLKRVPPREYKQRKTAWWKPGAITMSNELGKIATIPNGYELGSALAECRDYHVRSLYLLGGHTAVNTMPRSWFLDACRAGWSIEYERDKPRSYGFVDAEGYRIDVYHTAAWFGTTGEYNQDELARCRRAFTICRIELRSAFGPGATLLPTAAMTGLDLLEQSLPWRHEYPSLPPYLRETLYHNVGQGRMEVVSRPELGELAEAYCYDARWMYAACVHHLPSGPYIHKGGQEYGEYVPHAPGFYRVSVRVPRDWQHIGLLPCLRMVSHGVNETVYPSTPGEPFHTWISSAEYELAAEHGWDMRIHEMLVWPDTTHGDPLKTWADKLRNLRAVAELGERVGEDDTASLRKDAYRHLLLDTVGAFHRQQRRERHVAAFNQVDAIPAGVERHIEDYGVVWYADVPLGTWGERYAHPEWSGTVWGRARARLARAALTIPREQLLALRTDALWTSAPATFADTGKPGSFRLKHQVEHVQAPHNNADMLRLLAAARIQADESEE